MIKKDTILIITHIWLASMMLSQNIKEIVSCLVIALFYLTFFYFCITNEEKEIPNCS